MAGGYPSAGNVCNGQSTTTSSSAGVTLTGTTVGTKGTYVSLVTSLAADCCYAVITLDSSSAFAGSASEFAIDIAIGASGSQFAIVSNLVVTGWSGTGLPIPARYALPLKIPAGTQIWGRVASNPASAACRVNIATFSGAFDQAEGNGGVIDTYGFTLSTTIGTSVDPGATANTKGAWVQLSTGLAATTAGLILAFDDLRQSAGAQGGSMIPFLIDVGIGTSGSQVVIWPNIPLIKGCTAADGQQQAYGSPTPFVPIKLPAGTPLWVRASTTITTATDRLIGVTAYGLRT